MDTTVTLRNLHPSDSIPELTRLLHAAYAELAALGFNYTATDQSDAVTQKRISGGRCIVAAMGQAVVGTVLYKSPGLGSGSPHFARPDIASLHQFAVAPAFQAQGIGAMLLDFVEAAARADKATALALDTSEGASKLIAWYARRGFQFVEFAQWTGKTYRSVILSKDLHATAVDGHEAWDES
ncbi:MAG: GNAT family N-acetyltransferase [bacterium]